MNYMLDKIKSSPEKTAFIVGMSLLLGAGIIVFLLSNWFSLEIWILMIVEAIIMGVAILFILSAADKRHSRKN